MSLHRRAQRVTRFPEAEPEASRVGMSGRRIRISFHHPQDVMSMCHTIFLACQRHILRPGTEANALSRRSIVSRSGSRTETP